LGYVTQYPILVHIHTNIEQPEHRGVSPTMDFTNNDLHPSVSQLREVTCI